MKEKKKYILINILLFALLYFSVDYNKTYLRPTYGHIEYLKLILGSFPNFSAAFIINLFPLGFILKQNIKKARIIFYSVSILVFAILTLEEIVPMWGVSSVYDVYDVIASGIGVISAGIIFEMILHKRK